jgi:hypothetical protein
MSLLDTNRLFPVEPATRKIAQELFAQVENLPLICPHGHTDPRWFAENEPFADPAQLFVTPDHYVFRMLFSQGVSLTDLGVPRRDGGLTETDGRKICECLPRIFICCVLPPAECGSTMPSKRFLASPNILVQTLPTRPMITSPIA